MEQGQGKKILERTKASQRQGRYLGAFLGPLFLAILLSLSATMASLPAWAEGEDSDLDLIQEQVTEPTAQMTDSVLRLKVSDQVTYEISAQPDVTKMSAALGLNMIAEDAPPEDRVNPMEAYQSLNPMQQQKFQERRLLFLKYASSFLNKAKYASGTGSLVGRSFTFIKQKIQTLRGKTVQAPEPMTFKDRSHKITQSLLQNLDYKLWFQAPLLIASNEYGISGALGLSAVRGMGDSGAGGTEELGFNIGFDVSSRALVFEIFHSSENFKSSRMPVGIIGVPFKLGGYMASRKKGAETATMTGDTFYPPMLPMYSATGSDYYTAGISSSVSIPPSPIVDVLTFTNEYHRHAILRITLSHVMRGFVRVQVGDVKGSVVLITTRVGNILKAIAVKVREVSLSFRPGQCSSIFN